MAQPPPPPPSLSPGEGFPRPARWTLVCGPRWSGKTTLVNALMQGYRPSHLNHIGVLTSQHDTPRWLTFPFESVAESVSQLLRDTGEGDETKVFIVDDFQHTKELYQLSLKGTALITCGTDLRWVTPSQALLVDHLFVLGDGLTHAPDCLTARFPDLCTARARLPMGHALWHQPKAREVKVAFR